MIMFNQVLILESIIQQGFVSGEIKRDMTEFIEQNCKNNILGLEINDLEHKKN